MEADQAESPLRALLFLLLAGVCVVGFFTTGDHYDDYRIRYANTRALPLTELGFYVWYSVFGTLATVFGVLGLRSTRLPARLTTGFERLAERPGLSVLIASAAVFFGALAFRAVVLLDEPVTDDELVYGFIARTLLSGGVVNEPPVDPDFVRNQFVIAEGGRWYGKYPIGHPLLLAIGEAFGLRMLVPAAVGAISVAMTFAIGRRLVGPRAALLGSLLLAISPHWVWTSGTDLSQTTEGLCMLGGMWAMLRTQEGDHLGMAVVAGLFWGLALLARPFPGGLMIAAAGGWWLYSLHRGPATDRARRWTQLAVAGLCVAPFLATLLWVNHQHTGSWWKSGYSAIHGKDIPVPFVNTMAPSALGALVRQAFWLLGWPLALAACLLTRPRRAAGLFWGMLAAEYAYRLIVPKTVVATTGPTYVAEIVPLLCLGVADGLRRLVRRLERVNLPRPRETTVALLLAGTLSAAAMFVPVQVRNIHAGARARAEIYSLLASHGVTGRALIFGPRMVKVARKVTWAFFTPNPWPDLRDRLLFLRLPRGRDGANRAHRLWRDHFPDRRAFLLNTDGDEPQLYELAPPQT